MITNLKMSTRESIVKGRLMGMQQGVEEASEFLEAALTSVMDDIPDRISIYILMSELYYLDYRCTDAQNIFDKDIRPLLSELPPELAVLIADNGTLISLALLSGKDDFYHLVDLRRFLGIDVFDNKKTARIIEAVRKGKHNEALALCWQQLLSSYESQCWRSFYKSALDMARECLHLGLLSEASYNCMLSCDVELTQQIADSLLKEQDHHFVKQSLDYMLPYSQLNRHAEVVSNLISSIHDIIPDERVENVIDWLKKRADYMPTSGVEISFFKSIWNTIIQLSGRLTKTQASNIIDIALAHPFFNTPNANRQYIIDCINACISRVGTFKLPKIAESLLPLAGDNKSDFDFRNSINLLIKLAHLGDSKLQEQIKSYLYSSKGVTNSLLIEAAPSLGASIHSTKELDELVQRSAKHIMCQVEHLPYDHKPASIGGIGTIINEMSKEDGKIVVHISGAQQNINALIPNAALISESPLKELISSILDMIATPYNIINNRIELVQSFRRLLDYATKEIIEKSFDIIYPLARGEIEESKVGLKYDEVINPLNPHKMNFGNPVNLQGICLLTITEMGAKFPGYINDLHDELLLQTLSDSNSDLRAWGCIASQNAACLTYQELLSVILCTTDEDSNVSRRAFSVFHHKKHINFKSDLWILVATCIERGSLSPYVDVRQCVARTVTNILSVSEVPTEIIARLQQIQSFLSSDVSYSVRSVFQD